MTMNQIQAMLDCAGIREHNEYAALAALHDKKVRTKSRNLINHSPLAKEEKPSAAEYDKMAVNSLNYLKELRDGKSG